MKRKSLLKSSKRLILLHPSPQLHQQLRRWHTKSLLLLQMMKSMTSLTVLMLLRLNGRNLQRRRRYILSRRNPRKSFRKKNPLPLWSKLKKRWKNKSSPWNPNQLLSSLLNQILSFPHQLSRNNNQWRQQPPKRSFKNRRCKRSSEKDPRYFPSTKPKQHSPLFKKEVKTLATPEKNQSSLSQSWKQRMKPKTSCRRWKNLNKAIHS
mmetsp:Transcript_23992/g.58653  ORF Transcript_23992/g.58653 Transcript_23992/m.58653 type:complete len:207 (-) Transcript_23992:1776-2396(-)